MEQNTRDEETGETILKICKGVLWSVWQSTNLHIHGIKLLEAESRKAVGWGVPKMRLGIVQHSEQRNFMIWRAFSKDLREARLYPRAKLALEWRLFQTFPSNTQRIKRSEMHCIVLALAGTITTLAKGRQQNQDLNSVRSSVQNPIRRSSGRQRGTKMSLYVQEKKIHGQNQKTDERDTIVRHWLYLILITSIIIILVCGIS